MAHEIEEIIGLPTDHLISVSAKTGQGVPDLLEQLIERIPPPQGDRTRPLQALIIDSWFDNYLGIVSLVRVVHGSIRRGDRIVVKSVGRAHEIDDVGCFTPKPTAKPRTMDEPT